MKLNQAILEDCFEWNIEYYEKNSFIINHINYSYKL